MSTIVSLYAFGHMLTTLYYQSRCGDKFSVSFGRMASARR